MNDTTPALQQSLLLIWNNRDAAERLALMEKCYTPGVHFFERDGAAPFIGFEAINNLIGNLQQNWPATFEFTLQSPVKINNNLQYANWSLGDAGQAPAATGIDIALIEDSKITALYLFLNN